MFHNSLNPLFNELLRIPVVLPTMNDTITISVSDYDQGGYDDLVAGGAVAYRHTPSHTVTHRHTPSHTVTHRHTPSHTVTQRHTPLHTIAHRYDDLVADCKFSLSEIKTKGTIEPRWIPLYGIKGSKGLQDLREQFPHMSLDTCYKCRLLIAFSCEEVPQKLTARTKAIGPCSDPKKEEYVIRFDLLQASQLCERTVPDNTQIMMQLQVGSLEVTSTTVLASNGHVRWNEPFAEERLMLPSDLSQCPDIFFNINYIPSHASVASRLGYVRLRLQDAYGFNHAPGWATLVRDPLYPEVSAVPGFLEYRLDFGKASELPRSNREHITKEQMRKFQLRGHVYQATNLPNEAVNLPLHCPNHRYIHRFTHR